MLADQGKVVARTDVLADEAIAQIARFRAVVHQPGVGEHAGDRFRHQVAAGRRPRVAADRKPHVESLDGFVAAQVAAGAFGYVDPRGKGGWWLLEGRRKDKMRAEARRVGKECVSKVRTRW